MWEKEKEEGFTRVRSEANGIGFSYVVELSGSEGAMVTQFGRWAVVGVDVHGRVMKLGLMGLIEKK